jgi:tellurium resistance protein TerZ
MSNNPMLQAGSELPVDQSVKRYGIGISWDKSDVIVDIDLQAVIADDRGAIVDAVYYNNLKALKAAVTHSGDEQTGEKSGIDECIWVNFQKMPANVRVIIFVVAAYNRGHLRDARNGHIHVLEERKDNEVARFALEDSSREVDAVGMLVRSAAYGHWSLKVIDEPAEDGRHFIDILEPTLGNLIRGVIPGAPRKQKVAFAMEKGQVMDLQESSAIHVIKACLGWDVSPSAGDIDIDVSVVFFAKDGRDLGAVFFGNLEEFGVEHSGDNLNGEGSGDDEVITVNLESVPPECEQMCFVVNIYTKNVTFDKVSNAYCRVVDQEGSELAKYVLRDGRGENGLVIARMFREPGARWGFQALGTFCRGQNWKESLPDLRAIFNKGARELQLRGASSMSIATHPAPGTVPADVHSRVRAVPVQAAGGGAGCCTQQ